MRYDVPDRKGFTLVELLVVLLLATITTTSAMAVFINSNRVHLAQTAQIQLQQTARAGTDVLSAELREVSNGGGDIMAIGPDSISIRRMGPWTMVCDVVDYSAERFNVLTIGSELSENDSIALFAENDTLRLEDDVWLIGEIDDVDSGKTCASTPTAWSAHEIRVPGMAAAMAVDTVRRGAPLRTFVPTTPTAATRSTVRNSWVVATRAAPSRPWWDPSRAAASCSPSGTSSETRRPP